MRFVLAASMSLAAFLCCADTPPATVRAPTSDSANVTNEPRLAPPQTSNSSLGLLLLAAGRSALAAAHGESHDPSFDCNGSPYGTLHDTDVRPSDFDPDYALLYVTLGVMAGADGPERKVNATVIAFPDGRTRWIQSIAISGGTWGGQPLPMDTAPPALRDELSMLLDPARSPACARGGLDEAIVREVCAIRDPGGSWGRQCLDEVLRREQESSVSCDKLAMARSDQPPSAVLRRLVVSIGTQARERGVVRSEASFSAGRFCLGPAVLDRYVSSVTPSAP
jgi:hypothetical protein